MKVHEMNARCPVCGGPLEVTQAACGPCEVTVQGRFALLEFNRLSAAHLELLRMFVRTRGNLKEMGRAAGVSYPTIRARFEELLGALGYERGGTEEERRRARDAVLDALAGGEMSAADAVERLRELRAP